eukprot:6207345-Pleurochrysis_carterae.AAC.3
MPFSRQKRRRLGCWLYTCSSTCSTAGGMAAYVIMSRSVWQPTLHMPMLRAKPLPAHADARARVNRVCSLPHQENCTLEAKLARSTQHARMPSCPVGSTQQISVSSRTDERLHGSPRLVQRHRDQLELRHGCVGVVDPLWRVARLERYVPHRKGEMHEIEVDVVELQVGERLAARHLDVLGRVVRIPQLGRDPQLLATHEALVDGAPALEPVRRGV